MNSFTLVTNMIAWLLFMDIQPQDSSVLEKQLLLEKRAIVEIKRIPASKLDAELPGLSFAAWFEKVVGPGAEVIWQLSECGERQEAAPYSARDMRACIEANTILPDGRKVIVMIAVGTFNKGMSGAPAFNFGVIEQKGDLRLIQRLRDLPKHRSASHVSLAINPTVNLPDVGALKIGLAANNTPVTLLGAWSDSDLSQAVTIEEQLPAPPRPKPASASEGLETVTEVLKVLGAISWGSVIKKTQPRYPTRAKRVNASGPVKVQITIAEDGKVIVAKAVSGHPLLLEAAEEAARQWVFKPAALNGVPVKTETILVFVFTVPQ
jgi:TonB family protein